jgi:hypothetical protein
MLAPTGPFSLMSLCHAKLKMIQFMNWKYLTEMQYGAEYTMTNEQLSLNLMERVF